MKTKMNIGKYEISCVVWICHNCGTSYLENPEHEKGCQMGFSLGTCTIAVIPKDKLKEVLNILK